MRESEKRVIVAARAVASWDWKSFMDVKTDSSAYEDLCNLSDALAALDREEQQEKYVCECGYHINDCHCGLKQQKGSQ